MKYVPQLATLVTAPPSGDEWVHEIKYDGYRIGCRIEHGRVSLTSRNGKDWTAAFPEIVKAASALAVSGALFDGEVAIVLPDGRTSFQDLQHALSGSGSRANLVYFVFDLLELDGESWMAHPLELRKERLHALVGSGTADRLRYAEHIVGDGRALFEHARQLGLEGIVSKRRRGLYRPGQRGEWTKAKCTRSQAFVIGGFTDRIGAVGTLGALLLGCYEDSRLVFTGSVGTGFTEKVAGELRRWLDEVRQSTSPFTPPPTGLPARKTHWVSPELVCDVTFTEWTAEARVRHPSFQRLRPDMPPLDVRREP